MPSCQQLMIEQCNAKLSIKVFVLSEHANLKRTMYIKYVVDERMGFAYKSLFKSVGHNENAKYI